MRITFLTYETKQMSGSFVRSSQLARGLAERGHQIFLLTSAKRRSFLPRYTVENNVHIIESPGVFPFRFRHGGYDPLDFVFRLLYLLLFPTPVFHSFGHRLSASIPAAIAASVHRVQWYVDWADLWGYGGLADRRNGTLGFLTSRVDHWMETWIISHAHVVTVINTELFEKAKSLRANMPLCKIGVGADTWQVFPRDKTIARKELSISKNISLLAFLYASSYDFDFLIDSFAKIHEKNSNTHLLLIGPKLAELEKEISHYPNIKNALLQTGVVERKNISTYLAAADIFLLPYRDTSINRGRFPNKLGDYLAAGRPIITNPTGEVAKIFTSYSVGIVADETPTDMAEKALSLLADVKLQKHFGKNAEILAKQRSWQSLAKELERLYFRS